MGTSENNDQPTSEEKMQTGNLGENPNVTRDLPGEATIPDPTPQQPQTEKEADATADEDVNTISLYLPGLNEPLVITGKDRITFGRRDVQNAIMPTVDLSTNYGALLGVSRMHAQILFKDEGCVVEDLNSSNGTWVNERKIEVGKPHPLRNGDQVRLGQLLMIVYMTSVKHKPQAVKTTRLTEYSARSLFLFDPQAPAEYLGVSATYMHEALSKFLQTIETIETLVTSKQENHEPLLIKSILVEKSNNQILVHFTRPSQIVGYLRNSMYDYVAQRRQVAGVAEEKLPAEVVDNMLKELEIESLDTEINKQLNEALAQLLNSQIKIIDNTSSPS